MVGRHRIGRSTARPPSRRSQGREAYVPSSAASWLLVGSWRSPRSCGGVNLAGQLTQCITCTPACAGNMHTATHTARLDEAIPVTSKPKRGDARRPTSVTMIGHTDDETAVDGLLQPRLVDTIVPSKNPRLASWMFLLVPCLLVVGWYGSMPSATSSAATKLLAVAAGHTAWPKVAYGVSLGGCTLPHVEFTQTLGVLPPHASRRSHARLRLVRDRRARDGDQPFDERQGRAARPAAPVDVRPGRGEERARLCARPAPRTRSSPPPTTATLSPSPTRNAQPTLILTPSPEQATPSPSRQ